VKRSSRRLLRSQAKNCGQPKPDDKRARHRSGNADGNGRPGQDISSTRAWHIAAFDGQARASPAGQPASVRALEPPFSGNTSGMATLAAPDLSKQPPRSGRETLGRYAWLARLADKARAQHAGTLEYDDERLVTYFDEHVTDEQRAQANRFVLDEHADDLDKQDAEEGYASGKAGTVSPSKNAPN